MKVLFVCAGNLLRSVISEEVFNYRAGGLPGACSRLFEVESSGLEAEPGGGLEFPHPDSLRALEHIGLPAHDVVPVRTDEEHMRWADLAVAMTRQQSYVMASRFRDHGKKCFSLLEINGALWTLLGCGPVPPAGRRPEPPAVPADSDSLAAGLERARALLTGTPRELFFPLEGVSLNIRELMTVFGPCFHQASGVHDPMGGTSEELERCARTLDREVTGFLYKLVELGGQA